METQLFIPKKCKVGFNLRTDTYTGKLGYVIAFDGKKWRKEHSWEGWRNKVGDTKNGGDYIDGKWVQSKGKYGDEVTPIEFDNTPTSGFVLNKKAGGGRSHWNTRRTVSRIYDPRGFEFEIGIENLLYILEHCNCMRGKGLEGEFIYSWNGKDLVLLPCSSPEAEKANTYTDLQSQKIAAKDLVAGCSYKTKKEEDVIYVGRYMWYETDWYKQKGRKGKKYHIFINAEEKVEKDLYFMTKSDVSFLAAKNSDEVVSNFATIIDKFNKNPRSSDIIKCELIPTEISTETKKDNYDGVVLKKYSYFKQNQNVIIQYYVTLNNKYNQTSQKYELVGYTLEASKSFNSVTKEVAQLSQSYYRGSNNFNDYGYWNRTNKVNYLQEKDLKNLGYSDLFITLESGKRLQITDLDQI